MMPILQDVDLIKIVKVGIIEKIKFYGSCPRIPRLGDGVVVYLQSQFSLCSQSSHLELLF